MSKDQSLRELVNARLTVAAEEIFVLFDRTIAEYKEEMRRLKEENQRKQQLLDSVLFPTINLMRVDLDCPPGPEEQCIKQEEERSVIESTVGCIKTEESPSPLQQRQRKETQREDISAEREVKLENSSDHDKNWMNPLSSSECAEFEDYGDHYLQGQISKNEPGPETCALENNGVTSDTDGGAECHKLQSLKRSNNHGDESSSLETHMDLHTGDKPFSVSVWVQTFPTKDSLFVHKRVHTKERPYCCLICRRAFTKRCNLEQHSRIHTGEKPFSCRVCEKPFRRDSHLRIHMRTHTGEKPFTCSVCNKTFSQRNGLDKHARTHTGEKPFTCTVCEKSFRVRIYLQKHMRTHKGEKPYR